MWPFKKKKPDQVLTGDPAVRKEILDHIIARRIQMINDIDDACGDDKGLADTVSRIAQSGVDDLVRLEQKAIAAYLREKKDPELHFVAGGIVPLMDGSCFQRTFPHG